MRRIALAAACAVCWLQSSCGPTDRARASAPAPAKPLKPAPPVVARDTLSFPAGMFEVGSLPGTPGRVAAFEADLAQVQLGAFEIDRQPFPNQASQPARTGVTREQASALCAQNGKRLCSELEWERACKGDLQSSQREWTASTVDQGLGQALHTAVVRGAAAATRRCTARSGATPDTRADDLAFRCCSGAAEVVSYPTEPPYPRTEPLTLDQSSARAALASVPALAKLASSFTFFTRADADAALRRGGQSRDALRIWTFMPAAFAWSPAAGERLWVLSGRTAEGALLALLYPLGNGRYAHAASTVLAEPETTIAVGASEQYPEQLVWSSCYTCAGEGGTIRLRDDARVEIAYR